MSDAGDQASLSSYVDVPSETYHPGLPAFHNASSNDDDNQGLYDMSSVPILESMVDLQYPHSSRHGAGRGLYQGGQTSHRGYFASVDTFSRAHHAAEGVSSSASREKRPLRSYSASTGLHDDVLQAFPAEALVQVQDTKTRETRLEVSEDALLQCIMDSMIEIRQGGAEQDHDLHAESDVRDDMDNFQLQPPQMPSEPVPRARDTEIFDQGDRCIDGCGRTVHPSFDGYCKRCGPKYRRANAPAPTLQYASKMTLSIAQWLIYPMLKPLDIVDERPSGERWIPALFQAAQTKVTPSSLARKRAEFTYKQSQGEQLDDILQHSDGYYLDQQRTYNGKFAMEKEDPETRALGRYHLILINARMSMLFHQVVRFHFGGRSVYPIGGDSGGYGRPDRGMRIAARLQYIADLLAFDKLILMVTLEGKGVVALVENPSVFMKRKVQNRHSNQKKDKGVAATSSQTRNAAVLESTEASDIGCGRSEDTTRSGSSAGELTPRDHHQAFPVPHPTEAGSAVKRQTRRRRPRQPQAEEGSRKRPRPQPSAPSVYPHMSHYAPPSIVDPTPVVPSGFTDVALSYTQQPEQVNEAVTQATRPEMAERDVPIYTNVPDETLDPLPGVYSTQQLGHDLLETDENFAFASSNNFIDAAEFNFIDDLDASWINQSAPSDSRPG